MVSLEDELWRLFGDRANHPFLKTWEEHLGMDSKILSPMIQRAQRKVEEYYFESRKDVLNYDDVMNRQRELIYKERRKILEGVDLKPTIIDYTQENIRASVDICTPADLPQSDWEIDELFSEMDGYFMLAPVLTPDDLRGKSRDELREMLTKHVLNVYDSKEAQFDEMQGAGTMRELERWMALRAVNSKWMEHLANMDYLRAGIGLRGYEQKDPLLIYQKEAFDEFERMQQAIQDDIVRNVMRIQIVYEPPPEPKRPTLNIAPAIPLPDNLPKYSGPSMDPPRAITTNLGGDIGASRGKDGAPPNWKGGRNDPCWCGSGQKYKKCHGK
jgi:preprotein translocase subunit SecA